MIKKINIIENVGKFKKFTVDSNVNKQFEKLTVIYSENAQGKTTLSAIFRSLGTGNPDYISERRRVGAKRMPKVVVELNDGSNAIFEKRSWSKSLPQLLIFDETFVQENVCLGTEIASKNKQNLHELIIGKQGVKLNLKMNKLAIKIGKQQNLMNEIEKHILKNGNLYGFKVDYFCKLEPIANLKQKIIDVNYKLNAAQNNSQVISTDYFPYISIPNINLDEITNIISKGLINFNDEAIKQVKNHIKKLGKGGESWIEQGTEFVNKLGNDDCPYCIQPLKSSIIQDHYLQYFRKEYSEHKKTIQSSLDDFNESHSEIIQTSFERIVRTISELHVFWSTFAPIKNFDIDSESITNIWNSAYKITSQILERKIQNPLENIVLSNKDISIIVQHNNNCNKINTLNNKLKIINSMLKNIKNNVNNYKIKSLELEHIKLLATKSRYENAVNVLCNKYLQVEKSIATYDADRKQTRIKLNKQRKETISKFGVSINNFLRKFNATFTLGPIEARNHRGGTSVEYNLVIDGKYVPLNTREVKPQFKNTLSSGDRSTLALAFFFTLLEEDSHKGEKIVVIDDPMTSLDEHRSLHTRQEIRQLSEEVSSTIVLSHSKPFLFALCESCDSKEVNSLTIIKTKNGSDIVEWKAREDIMDEHDTRIINTIQYLENHDKNIEKEVAVGIRPILERYCRVAYPNIFKPDTSLGKFVYLCKERAGKPNQIMSKEFAIELEKLKEYANKFHHDTNKFYESERITRSELENFADRTLHFLQKE